jgi:hypothetical protein
MTAKKTTPGRPAAANILSGVVSNLEDSPVPDEFRMDIDQTKPVLPESMDARSERAREERVWVQLEDSDDIPPGGQFISVNGYGYKLIPGYPAHVPVSVLGVLDNAITSIAVVDPLTKQVVGWRDRLRLPYRVLTNYKPPVKAGAAQ